MKLIKKIRVTAGLELITGLHIGDSKENVEIGGVDLPIVRRRDNRQPYIPGSSIKGKMRCLLEQMAGATKVGKNTEVNTLFGITENRREQIQENIPSRLIVRDAYLEPASAEWLGNSEFTDLPYSEIKWENSIDRVKGKAEHPRQIERVPAGARFNLEFIINVWDDGKEDDMKSLFKKGIDALINDYLGGHGSRGYGQVKIDNLKYEDIHFHA